MPYPFILPTTSVFSFSSSFQSESHPSLPLNASTRRGVVRDSLKKHKRLAASSQPANLPTIAASINSYLPYLVAIDAQGGNRWLHGEEVRVVLRSTPSIAWRPTISDNAVPGKEPARVKIYSAEHELFFTLATLAYTFTLLARATLHPLYMTSSEHTGPQQRTSAITTATKHLLEAASIHDYMARRAENLATVPPCVDIGPAATRALSSLALAEATLLAVLKDDPYPAVVAQDRSQNDREWMFKAPDIPKVRAHLFARLCLAAADHAAQASSLLQSAGKASSKLDDGLVLYVEGLRRSSRAKACRFFGIDAEISGQMGNALGWLRCGLQELGIETKDTRRGLSLSRVKKEWSGRREDRRVERGTNWGADAGKLEESRVIEMLDAKWTKVNDTMLTQAIAAPPTLLSTLPSGRDIHSIKPYCLPELSKQDLSSMWAPPDEPDDFADGQMSSDEEDKSGAAAAPVGAFPGTDGEYRSDNARSYF